MGVLLGLIGIFTLMTGVVAVASIVNGYVVSTLWSWFIVPIFGLAPLTIPMAIGVGLLVSYMTMPTPDVNKSSDKASENINSILAVLVYRPLMTLGIGWCVLSFI